MTELNRYYLKFKKSHKDINKDINRNIIVNKDWMYYYHTDPKNIDFNNRIDKFSAYGEIDKVKFLYEYKKELYTQDAVYFASSRGYLDIIIYLYTISPTYFKNFSFKSIELAKENGHKDIVKFIELIKKI